MGMLHRILPLTYLGVSIGLGRSKTVHFEYLLDKVRHALEGWEARLLSFGGNMTLIY